MTWYMVTAAAEDYSVLSRPIVSASTISKMLVSKE